MPSIDSTLRVPCCIAASTSQDVLFLSYHEMENVTPGEGSFRAVASGESMRSTFERDFGGGPHSLVG